MNARKAFTLVELLIVVAILAVLVALLLPAMRRVRRTAQTTHCAGNLHQVGIGLSSYLSANRFRYPPRTQGTMFSWLGQAGTGGYGAVSANTRHLNPYIHGGPMNASDKAPFAHCPADAGARGIASAFDRWGTSYGANVPGYYTGGPSINVNNLGLVNEDHGLDPAPGVTMDEVKDPSRMIAMADIGFFYPPWNNAAPPQVLYYHAQAGENRWNVLFADGHVGWHQALFNVMVTDEWTMERDK